jgi:hypothetical protein
MDEPVKSTHPTASVELEDDHVLIRDLSMDGALAELVRVGVEDGRDPEAIVREAIEVGAAVLIHGAAKSTVDAVGAEVDRLLTALNERSLCQGSREFPRCDHGNSSPGGRPVSAGRSAAMASRWRRMR